MKTVNLINKFLQAPTFIMRLLIFNFKGGNFIVFYFRICVVSYKNRSTKKISSVGHERVG